MPVDWGRPGRAEELLSDAFDLQTERRVSTMEEESGEAVWQLFLGSFGPVKTLAGALDDDRREEFHRAWVDMFEQKYRSGDRIVQPREYLLVLGTRR